MSILFIFRAVDKYCDYYENIKTNNCNRQNRKEIKSVSEMTKETSYQSFNTDKLYAIMKYLYSKHLY